VIVWKLDLLLTDPGNGEVINETKPTFKWEPYPEAAYYKITISKHLHEDAPIYHEKVDGSEFTPTTPLENCKYLWYVEAYNAHDVVIAHAKPAGSPKWGYFAWHGFNVVNGPKPCQ
jgi:hypothetical protein